MNRGREGKGVKGRKKEEMSHLSSSRCQFSAGQDRPQELEGFRFKSWFPTENTVGPYTSDSTLLSPGFSLSRKTAETALSGINVVQYGC